MRSARLVGIVGVTLAVAALRATALAETPPQIAPTTQDRFVTGSATATSASGRTSSDTQSAAASDLGPFDVTVSAVAAPPGAGSVVVTATQNSTITTNQLTASGQVSAVAGAGLTFVGATGESQFEVKFTVDVPMVLKLNGQIKSMPGSFIPKPLSKLVLSSPTLGTIVSKSTSTGTFNWSNTTVVLMPAEYELLVESQMFGSTAAASTLASFSITLTVSGPLTCGANPASCATAHTTPYCSWSQCCEVVCAMDPHCCEVAWDAACVALYQSECVSASAVTGWLLNPATEHHYIRRSSTPWLLQYNLGRIGSAEENEWIRRNLATNVPGPPDAPLWIGLSDHAAEGVFAWEPGDPRDLLNTYTAWAPGQPGNAFADAEDFVALDHQSGAWMVYDIAAEFGAVGESTTWLTCGPGRGSCYEPGGFGCEDVSCCHLIIGFDQYCFEERWDEICAAEALALCAPTPIEGPIYNATTHHRYYLLRDAAWTEASEVAYHLKGHLVVFSSAEEGEWVRLNFAVGGGAGRTVWIGLHDLLVADAYQWVTHEPYTSPPVEPESKSFFVQYVAMNPDGTLHKYVQWEGMNDPNFGFSVVEVPCAGDLDESGAVDAVDLAILLGAWNVGPSAYDIDVNGNVDAADLATLLGGWGACGVSPCCSGGSGVACDQPGCVDCVCAIAPDCCDVSWDAGCVDVAISMCPAACQCPVSPGR